jgi:outer membrane protein assembly factor BamA
MYTLLKLLFILIPIKAIGQNRIDSVSKFDRFNHKAEKIFSYLPVPLYAYTQEAGHTFGLAKFNMIELYKNDTVTQPSKFVGDITFSSKGRINFYLSNELILKNNEYIFINSFNYKKIPRLIYGIGNDVSFDEYEKIILNVLSFNTIALKKIRKYFYTGLTFNYDNYFKVESDTNSVLLEQHSAGLKGGLNVGIGITAAYDSRDNRYNPMHGTYVLFTSTFYGPYLFSDYTFSKVNMDARKYFNPWYKHIIAIQATTNSSYGNVPFYNLAFLGGPNQMRGYYEGAIRDYILVDGQIEYRLPIWKIFGIVGWVGTGRVASSYSEFMFKDFWVSYGGGIRIKVDSKHNTNLRFDYGFGSEKGINGFVINFAEAF